MANKSKSKPRRSMSQIANALYETPPVSRDPARAFQEAHRARGSMSPLSGAALVNPMLGAMAAAEKAGRRK